MSWTNNDLVEVRTVNGERGVFARCDILAGCTLGLFDGRAEVFDIRADGTVDYREWGDGRMVLQMGVLMPGSDMKRDKLLALVPLPDDVRGIDYINHSCDPNCRVGGKNGLVIVTRRKIVAGEEITIDYRHMDIVPAGKACWCDKPEGERCVL